MSMDLEALKQSFLKKFQEDTGDRLQKIQLGVLDLEKPEAAASAEMVARELHTMKGEARILGLAAIGQLAHAAEDLLKEEQEKKVATGVATDLLLRACDAISDLLEDIEGAKNGTDAVTEMCNALAAASGHPVPALRPSMSSFGGGPLTDEQLGVKKVEPTSPPAPAPSAQPPSSAQPAPSAAPSAAASAAPAVAARSKTSSAADSPAGTPEPLAPTEPKRETAAPEHQKVALGDRSIRVNVETLDAMGLVAGDLLVESARTKLRSTELNEVLERFARMGDRFLRVHEQAIDEASTRRAVEVLENDLHLLRDDAFRFVRTYMDGLNSLHGNLLQLADHVAEARLVPLASVFEAFPRAVRDIAKGQGKEVELTILNPGLGVDRSMLQDVRDALVHLLRNAVDHGLETPDARQLLGKPTKGTLAIRVRADGDMLHVEVEDDGRGMDPERMRQVAVKRGVLNAAAAQALTDREAIELIFRPGFSTRDEVTDLSGRGVGMDVVKRKVEALGGSVSVVSRLGRGSTIHLRLPQSLALMRVLLVRLGGDVYGIPAADVEAVIRVKPQDRVEVFGTLAVQHRGNPVALVALGSLLGLNGGPSHDRPPAVVVRHGSDRAALAVDGFVDEREVAVKPCGGDFLKGLNFIAGSAALEDGRIAVLLKVPDIMTEVRRVSRPTDMSQMAKRLRILLVDDSPIARATESALVKALGHSVDEAKDGEEGLQRAAAGAYDLILTDVQMPRMDGFTLTRKLKTDPKLGKLPVVILSSLASPEDRRRGADAGADAYLVKGELGVEVLAQTLDRLT